MKISVMRNVANWKQGQSEQMNEKIVSGQHADPACLGIGAACIDFEHSVSLSGLPGTFGSECQRTKRHGWVHGGHERV
jgi:hypothetical protein